MTWTNKTEGEIRDAILGIAKDETGLTSFKEGGVLRGLIETFTKTIFSLYENAINFYGGQFTYLLAEGAMLDLRGQELGLVRQPARKASGSFSVVIKEGKAPTISEGAWFLSSTGLRFKALEDSDLDAGRHDISVEAEFAGAKYNIIQDNNIHTTTVLDGLESVKAPRGWIGQSGRDEESDGDYRARIQARWESQGEDDRPSKYVEIALSNPEINDARIIRIPRGPGSIDLILGGAAGIPSEAVRSSVETDLRDAKLLARDILVKAATVKEQEFRLTFKGKPTVREVQETLRLWLQKRKVGEDITMKALYQEALFPLSINELEFQAPTQDIEVEAAEKVSPTSISATREG